MKDQSSTHLESTYALSYLMQACKTFS